MKILKKILLFLLIIFLAAQFFRPDKNEGELRSLDFFVKETKPTENVHKILKQACFDCHSNVTKYPWYSSITPLNYWIADHIEHGKEELNFSNWKTYSVKRKEHKFEEIWEEVEKKHMPLDSYTWMHSEAKLSSDQIELVINWAKQVQASYKKELDNQ